MMKECTKYMDNIWTKEISRENLLSFKRVPIIRGKDQMCGKIYTVTRDMGNTRTQRQWMYQEYAGWK